MDSSRNQKLNILYKIKGDIKFGKKTLLFLFLFLWIFLLLILIFSFIPSKYSRISNDINTSRIQGNFLRFFDKDDLVYTGYFKNLEPNSVFYFYLNLNLNRYRRTYRNFNINVVYYTRIIESNSEITDQNIVSYNSSQPALDKKHLILSCNQSRCHDNLILVLKDFKYKNVYIQLDFNILDKINNLNSFEIETYSFNPNYKIPNWIYRLIITILSIIIWIFYFKNLKNLDKKNYSFEQENLLIWGILIIFYNDPLYFIKLFLNSLVYNIIYSVELIVFITFYLYFNILISIRMNLYDGVLKYKFNWKILPFFIIFFGVSLANIIIIENSRFFHFNIFDNNIGANSLKIINFILVFIVFIGLLVNYIQTFIKFNEKSDKTKGLIFFILIFNLIFIGNILSSYYIYVDPINSELIFFSMLNLYFYFLCYYFSFNLKKITENTVENKIDNNKIDNQQDINNNYNNNMGKENIMISMKTIDVDQNEIPNGQKISGNSERNILNTNTNSNSNLIIKNNSIDLDKKPSNLLNPKSQVYLNPNLKDDKITKDGLILSVNDNSFEVDNKNDSFTENIDKDLVNKNDDLPEKNIINKENDMPEEYSIKKEENKN